MSKYLKQKTVLNASLPTGSPSRYNGNETLDSEEITCVDRRN